jgi:hypothetical protein
MIKQFTEFSPEWLHNKVINQLTSPELKWSFPNFGNNNDLTQATFCHCPFNWQYEYSNWSGVESLSYVLDYWLYNNKDWFEFKGLNRCLINFYTASQYTDWHTDHTNNNCFTLLYYANDSDGGTEFKDNKIMHKENTGIFFNSTATHRPIRSTTPRRLSVSWVLEGNIKEII